MIVKLLGTLIGSIVGLVGDWGKGKQEALMTRLNAMQRSWTDEFITVVYFSPLMVAWFAPERSEQWVAMVQSLPAEYNAVLAGITAAVFGLGKINGRKK